MPTVAELLREARETQGLTVYQVSDLTKIKTEHIRCLEAAEYDTFSAPVYIRGFVRVYASVLKLEVPEIMAQLDAELARLEKFSEPPRLTETPNTWLDFVMLQFSKVNWRIVLPALVCAAVLTGGIIGLRAWRQHQDKDPLTDLGPGLYDDSASNRIPTTLAVPVMTNGSGQSGPRN